MLRKIFLALTAVGLCLGHAQAWTELEQGAAILGGAVSSREVPAVPLPERVPAGAAARGVREAYGFPPGERGLIVTHSGTRINCAQPASFTNAEYRRLRESLDASPIGMAHLLYATAPERPQISALADFRQARALNPAELYAILAYTGGDYDKINKPLWTTDAAGIEKMSLPISVICSGLSRLPNYSGEVRRGTSFAGDLESLGEGDIYVNKAFMSTSIGQVDLYSKLPVQLRIFSKSGKRIDYLSFYGEHSVSPEKEVLFIPQSRFRVKSKKVQEKNYKKYYEIELEELDAPAEVFGGPQQPAQPLVISGEASAADGAWNDPDKDSRRGAEEACRKEKNRSDILGECYLSCSKAGKVSRCSWAASDWMSLNPFAEKEAMDNFYQLK